MYSMYFLNLTTGEVFCRKQRGATAYKALCNFRKYLRTTKTLSSGDHYRIEIYTAHRSLDDIPDELYTGRYHCVAR